jgi:prepilin-type N-terminal cleavage/methylation domain-containing protein
MKKQAGFTLVEIAIVMVIIGLLLGGVLKGQEIITNAKIKKLENDYQGVTAAIYSYQDRYRALPGDDSRADDRFGSVAAGDGNGKVKGNFNSTTDTEESRLFWLHLRNAGLVAGATDEPQQPPNAFNGVTGVSSENGAGLPPGALFVGFSGIPYDIARIVESQQDDGESNNGNVQASLDGTTTAATSYEDNKVYNLFLSL